MVSWKQTHKRNIKWIVLEMDWWSLQNFIWIRQLMIERFFIMSFSYISVLMNFLFKVTNPLNDQESKKRGTMVYSCLPCNDMTSQNYRYSMNRKFMSSGNKMKPSYLFITWYLSVQVGLPFSDFHLDPLLTQVYQ